MRFAESNATGLGQVIRQTQNAGLPRSHGEKEMFRYEENWVDLV
jgi:hypothetical protein